MIQTSDKDAFVAASLVAAQQLLLKTTQQYLSCQSSLHVAGAAGAEANIQLRAGLR